MTTDAKLEEIAEQFHEVYERLAPDFGYDTRRDSAVAWDDVPEPNRNLTIAVVKSVVGPFLSQIETLQQERGNREAQIDIHVEQIRQLQEHIASLERVRVALKTEHHRHCDCYPCLESRRHEREHPKK